MEKIIVDKDKAFDDPVYFIEKFTSLKLAPGQKEVLRALPECKRIIVKAGRRWGKTSLGGAAAVWFLWTRPNVKVGYFSPSWDQCQIFMDEVYNKILNGSLLYGSVTNALKFSLDVSNGSKLIAKTANLASQSGRGHGFDFIIPDESAFIPDEVMAAIRPTRLVGKSWELQMSNPCGHNHFYHDFNSKMFKQFSFKSIDNPMVDKKELAMQKELMTDFQFKQEFEAEFIDDEFSVFPQKLIDDSLLLGLARNVKFLDKGLDDHNYYMGVDLGRKQDKSVIIIVDHLHPFVDLVFYKEIKNDFSEAYWTKVLDEIENAVRIFKVKALNIDQTSIGDKPTLDLKQTFREKNIPCVINGVIFSSNMKNSRDGLVNSLLMQFERNFIAIPHYPVLIKQLKNVRRKIIIKPTREITSTFSLTGLDHVTALALAVQAVPLFAPSLIYAKTNERIATLKNITPGVMKSYGGCERNV